MNKLKQLGTFKDTSDGSVKSVFESANNKIIEITLLFNKPDKDVVCAPTHHFCNLGCKMCHLTNSTLNKKMEPIKYEDFIEALLRTLSKPNGKKRTNKDKLLISFMGVGEPLLNLDLIKNVYLNEYMIKEKYGYKSVSYALATMMPNKNILELKDMVRELNIPLKIHFSLHSPIDRERISLIPYSKVEVDTACKFLIDYSIAVNSNDQIMQKYEKYHSNSIPVEIHYTLIEGVNDNDEQLEKLKQLLNTYKIPMKLIRFNPINNMKVSDKEDYWVSELRKIDGLKVKTYTPPGKQIGSSCGEFTKHYYHEDIETEDEKAEFKRWKLEHKIYENQRRDYISWDDFFMGIALLSSQRSKDNNTQVGACIVSEDKRILSIGYNGAPNGFDDDYINYDNDGEYELESKYPSFMVHAEANAIVNFKGGNRELKGSTIYVTLFPCNECAKLIVQSGIKSVVYLTDKHFDKNTTIAAKEIFDKCGVTYTKFDGKISNVKCI